MYGEIGKIGLIIPSVNTVMEPEFNAMKPEGVSVHTTRVPFLEDSIENLNKMNESTINAAQLLASAKMNIIAFGCTTGSMFRGLGWDETLIKQIEQTTMIPATTTASSVIAAFRALNVTRVAVITPYQEETTGVVVAFLKSSGLQVVNCLRLSTLGLEMHAAPPEATYKLARMADKPEAEAIFISCTNFKSVPVIDLLEKDLGKYVLSSNTATMWQILQKLGIKSKTCGYGRLFQ